ncbi:MAG: hypothetical protein DI563_32565 [Variovorax paradoxus]|uniref:Uncharacterized protein n=1 Tax=Variovorax paradoxus TaxID=34073 RepID=A0A2W5NS72_VARPD|nr:MAG: hypothetical protein DI563_32565 [Variovorax paradoxus]
MACFQPRPVRTPSVRKTGWEWLNGPLVWAISEEHQRLYLFPRECPRVVIWARPESSAADRSQWLGNLSPGVQAVAYVESAWERCLASAEVFRYTLPTTTFESIEDAGMFVSRQAVRPLAIERISDLPSALNAAATELRIVGNLASLKDVWSSSLHASGIRLRNTNRPPI